ncbi:MAG: hypothetical protein M1828_004081 [Chrysothrix sp. TS-e1954]|nr:MAG: hypothetical protein M1828_004081 [Chrysothrix sp. TS-e1954]
MRVLKDQAKRDFNARVNKPGSREQVSVVVNGSEKSKSPSPTSDRSEDVSQHHHLIPRIIPTLYARYRDRVVEDVKSHEKQYDSLLQQLRQLQAPTTVDNEASRNAEPRIDVAKSAFRDKADVGPDKRTISRHASSENEPQQPITAKLSGEAVSWETNEKGLQPTSQLGQIEQVGETTSEAKPDSRTGDAGSGVKNVTKTEVANNNALSFDTGSQGRVAPAFPAQHKSRQANTSIDSIINHDPIPEEKHKPTIRSQDERIYPTTSARDQAAVPENLPISHPSQSPHGTPGYHQQSPTLQQHPHVSPTPRQLAPSPNAYSASRDAASQSQRNLPPIPAMQPPLIPPNSHWNAGPDMLYANQRSPTYNNSQRQFHPQDRPYGMQNASHYEQGRSPPAQYSSTHPPPDPYRQPPPQHYSTPNGRPPSQYPPYTGPVTAPPRQGGVFLPPFQVSMSSNSNQTQYPKTVAAPVPQRQPQPKTVPTPLNVQTLSTNLNDLAARTPTSLVNTPRTSSWTKQQLGKNVTITPGSSTAWKTPVDVKMQGYLEELPAPPVSPTLGRALSPQPGESHQRPLKQPPLRKGKLSRKSQATSEATDGNHTRSQSPESQQGVAGQVKRGSRLKQDPPTPDTAVPDLKLASKRKRPGFATGNDVNPQTPSGPASPAALTVSQPPEYITAFRNFNKMAAPLMNTVSSHKHASLFATPVTDRQAEGYSSFIKRPQDLKSIRAALAAGQRAVAAAAMTQAGDSPGSAKDSTTVVLERSKEVIPPKAIVNAAQLEQELMRMFANAVMFAPGDDDEMVIDTRDMVESVDKYLAEWRAAESRLGMTDASVNSMGSVQGDEGTELGDGEGSVGSGGRATKRRRL